MNLPRSLFVLASVLFPPIASAVPLNLISQTRTVSVTWATETASGSDSETSAAIGAFNEQVSASGSGFTRPFPYAATGGGTAVQQSEITVNGFSFDGSLIAASGSQSEFGPLFGAYVAATSLITVVFSVSEITPFDWSGSVSSNSFLGQLANYSLTAPGVAAVEGTLRGNPLLSVSGLLLPDTVYTLNTRVVNQQGSDPDYGAISYTMDFVTGASVPDPGKTGLPLGLVLLGLGLVHFAIKPAKICLSGH
jgi:hypothetical protein